MSCAVIRGSRKDYYLQVDVTTSTFQEHNAFDYESTVQELSETISSHHQFTLDHHFVHIFRNRKTFKTEFGIRQSLLVKQIPENCEHLGVFQIRYVNKTIMLRMYQFDELISVSQHGPANIKVINNSNIHQMYAIVRSFKNQKQESIGYKIKEGSFLRIGQKQYFVSSVCCERELNEGDIQDKIMLIDDILNDHRKIKIPDGKQEGECKYCMMEEGPGEQEFLCSPCKCSGSCALVHFACLQRWNQSKVKKSKVKGLTYYNFQKFFCEVCKEEYPKMIQKHNKVHELMPIEMPKGEHIILEEVEVKSSSLILIEDISSQGIRMGRGNQCQIRVDNSSISRNHARIVRQYGEYYVFDNKSKFGTLVKDTKLYLEADHTKKGIQIDRSVFMFSINKKESALKPPI